MLQLIGPYLIKIFINRVILRGEMHYLVPIIVLAIAASVVRGVFSYSQQYFMELLGQNTLMHLRQLLYRKLMDLSFEYYDHVKTGQLISRLTGDIEMVRMIYAQSIPQLTNFVTSLTFVIVILFHLDKSLGMLTLWVVPVLLFTVVRFDQRIRPAFLAQRQQFGRLTTRLQEAISGIRVVKAFAQENRESVRFATENQGNFDKNMAAVDIWSFYFPLLDAMANSVSAALFLYGGFQVIRHEINLGTLVAAIGYLWQLVWPLSNLGGLLNVVIQGHAAAERLLEIEREVPTVRPPASPVSVPRLRGEVYFDHVSFSYRNGPPALQDVCLHVPAGSTVALLGTTGSGKSTLVYLLARFYDVTEGALYLDGHDVRTLDLRQLRRQVAFVLQESFLFSATVRDNIAFGRPDAPLADIVAAAKAAHAHEFIMELPQGYDTVVGERGVGLSGGQKQRIAIARALLMDPAILVLDEATSSVDTRTEMAIQDALSRLLQHRTSFVIAHRLATLRRADLVVVMSQGRVVEAGRHQELLARSGLYRRIHDLQFQDQAALFG